ncbi:MAG: bifunctional glycosyltransferase family 2/GtrA family protein [Clostridia bacterium]|nr:bifunctional glycosyltransferase family 2/GtrA family protein [Clostridia bacterium]
MKRYTDVTVVIPSLSPDEKLLSLLADLKEVGFAHVLLVNDGSTAEYDRFFAAAREEYGYTVLTHTVNQGKGRALKTAFNHLLCQGDTCGAVTVDADGQHRIADIIAVSEAVLAHPESLVMGCRDFESDDPNIPPRSRFGNRLTSRLLKLLCGIALSDTQTGLRGFSPAGMRRFLSTKGERFEYEMNMILDAHESGMPLLEVPIETVYIEENRSSHFNPLLDSARIYSVFLKFLAASLSSFVVDILAYTVLLALMHAVTPSVKVETQIIVATYVARVLSGLFNFTVNKQTVFKSHGNTGKRLGRYALVSVIQVSLSAFATSGLFALLHWNATWLKLLVDTVLFLISFRVQRGWVFKQ